MNVKDDAAAACLRFMCERERKEEEDAVVYSRMTGLFLWLVALLVLCNTMVERGSMLSG